MFAYIKKFEEGSLPVVIVRNTKTGIEREIEFNLQRSGIVGDNSYQISDRELANISISRKNWDSNIEVYDGWTQEMRPCQKVYEHITYGNFEDQLSYEVAVDFVDSFNRGQQR